LRENWGRNGSRGAIHNLYIYEIQGYPCAQRVPIQSIPGGGFLREQKDKHAGNASASRIPHEKNLKRSPEKNKDHAIPLHYTYLHKLPEPRSSASSGFKCYGGLEEILKVRQPSLLPFARSTNLQRVTSLETFIR
jgi:hypothetical protein